MKRLLPFIGFIILLISIPVTLQVVKNQQDVRQRAQEGGQLVCQPQGGMANKFNSDTLVIKNNKSAPVNIWVQENVCNYEDGLQIGESYHCDTMVERYPNTLQPGEERSYRRDAKSCKVVQIDANTDGDDKSGCYTPDGNPWDGGLAFTIKANSNCAEPTNTPKPTKPPRPTNTPKPTNPPRNPTSTPTPSACVTPRPVTNIKVECINCKP